MTGENYLLAVARIALTFVGFASLVALLRHSGRDWLPQEVKGLKLMFEFDLAATLFALLPFPLLYTFGPKNQAAVWRISGSLLTAYLLGTLWYHYKSHKSGPRLRHPKVFRWLFLVPMCIFACIQTANVIFWVSLAAYAWTLLWLLIPPIVQFSLFILHFGEDRHNTQTPQP